MYIDYEILKTLKEHNLSMPGKDLLNATIPNEKPVFTRKVLVQMEKDGLVIGSIKSQCTLTPKGAMRLIELERQREEFDAQKKSIKQSNITAWVAIVVSVLGVAGSILIALIS